MYGFCIQISVYSAAGANLPLRGRGTAAQAVVDEGRSPTGCGISRNLYTVFPHPSALRADTFPQGKVLRVAANRTINTNLSICIFDFFHGQGNGKLPAIPEYRSDQLIADLGPV